MPNSPPPLVLLVVPKVLVFVLPKRPPDVLVCVLLPNSPPPLVDVLFWPNSPPPVLFVLPNVFVVLPNEEVVLPKRPVLLFDVLLWPNRPPLEVFVFDPNNPPPAFSGQFFVKEVIVKLGTVNLVQPIRVADLLNIVI